MKPTHHTSTIWRSSGGFTLIELTICLAIVAVLASLALPIHLEAVEGAKAVEATSALTEVVRLERLRFAETGTYTADLQELGFQLVHSLQYTELFVEVRKDAKGWSYRAFAIPRGGQNSHQIRGVTSRADGSFDMSFPGTLKSGGGSACSVWTGWGSMEGGRIEGEETLSASSSTGGSGSPCGGRRVVDHGKQ
ncbi:MAG TPA: prepilin-type N-terminal cleavage/methylation domain-containing protein [Nitrospira sp.]|nr:prepilin-type N-terminal cleavage/methylation domain-containing protein [Nitrospira sp.]